MSQRVTDRERDEWASNLKDQQVLIQSLFMNRSREKNEEIDYGEIVACHYTVFTFLPFYEPQSLENQKHKFPDRAQFFFLEGRFTETHKSRFGIKLRKSMSWARNEVEKLGYRVKEVDDLRDEEK